MATVTQFPTADTAWQRTVHAVAAKARSTFPSLGGKIDHATALVLAGAVEPAPAAGPHAYLVASAADPTGMTCYDVTCGAAPSCTCEDFTHRHEQEADFKCKHLLAVWIYRRAQAASQPEPQASAPALPEAAFSITLKGTMGGAEALLTARGATFEEFARNVAALRGLLDPVPPERTNAPATQSETPLCPVHGPMKQSSKAPGTWFCSKRLFDGSYCKERHPKS